MSFHLKRNLWIFTILLLVIQLAKCQDEKPQESEEEEEDDSSSEETVEDSNESGNQRRRRRRRSADLSEELNSKSIETEAKPNFAIPGLPDPSTILKIAEILTRVGQEVLPTLVEAING
ncbi:antennal-specific protein OS-C isoform X2 [Stomoxys calcitrans]|uniref:antennal-specific protein OS-C isoform X2 n=1 Tax=Stomoxys calcitrans TaxID=35570 RepID=UPI0027E38608|nr:antennal-specific protein OS-C isoform X2 [Stomoxys calcitrans]